MTNTINPTGPTIINPSFEVDPVLPPNGMGAVTGWTGASGITDANGPYADNGAIPEGAKVAFIQGPGTMRQTVAGFTVGARYRLRYYENLANCCARRLRRRFATARGPLKRQCSGGRKDFGGGSRLCSRRVTALLHPPLTISLP